MPYPLTIQNLSSLQRLAKNVQRAVRAIIYSGSGGIEPANAVGFNAITAKLDIAALRTAVAAAASEEAALTVVVEAVSQYVQ